MDMPKRGEAMGKRVTVYHVTPICKKCSDEVLKIRRAAERAGTGAQVSFSLWRRLKYGLKLLGNPVVVIDDRPFSVLGAFGEETLVAELQRKE